MRIGRTEQEVFPRYFTNTILVVVNRSSYLIFIQILLVWELVLLGLRDKQLTIDSHGAISFHQPGKTLTKHFKAVRTPCHRIIALYNGTLFISPSCFIRYSDRVIPLFKVTEEKPTQADWLWLRKLLLTTVDSINFGFLQRVITQNYYSENAFSNRVKSKCVKFQN